MTTLNDVINVPFSKFQKPKINSETAFNTKIGGQL
jgi:hypothetical protein